MSVLSQRTHIYVLDDTGATPEVVRVECVTNFTPGGDPADQIEDTCLEDSERTYKSGLRTPGQATLGLNSDPEKDSHLTLYNFSRQDPNPVLKWAVGWSDGTVAPRYGYGVVAVSVDAGGSSYSDGTTSITFSDPEDADGVTAAGVATIVDGAITEITITDPGSGYSAAPTVTINDSGTGTGATATATLADRPTFVFPGDRTWFTFQGYVADFPFDFSQNTVVTTEVSIQRSGDSNWIKKAAA